MSQSTLFIAPALTSILLLTACSGSSNNETSNDPILDITVVPVNLQAMARAEPVGTPTQVDLSSVTPETGYRNLSIESMSTDPNAPLLILHQFINIGGESSDRYLGYDLSSLTFTTVVESAERLSSYSISRDGTSMAWLDGSSCNLWHQSLQPLTDPQRINDLLPEFSCPRPPTVSPFGDSMWFIQAVGRYNDNGDLVYEGFDSDNFHTAIVAPNSQNVIELAQNVTPIGDPELDAMSRTLLFESSSHDGQRLVFRAYFLPRSYPMEGLPEYVVGTLLVDALSGEINLLNQNRYERFYSQKVPPGVQDDATVSGDGRIVWYVESVGINVDRELAPSVLKRLDLETGQIVTIDVPGFKDSLWASDDGNRLLFLLDGEVVVYRHDTGDLLRTTNALKFCIDPTDSSSCEIDNTRNVLNDPAMLSGDGNTVLIRLILERPNIDTPQNVMELMLLDVNSGTLQRVAPDRDILWVEMTHSAQKIAYLDELADDGTYLSTPRLMIMSRQ